MIAVSVRFDQYESLLFLVLAGWKWPYVILNTVESGLVCKTTDMMLLTNVCVNSDTITENSHFQTLLITVKHPLFHPQLKQFIFLLLCICEDVVQ